MSGPAAVERTLRRRVCSKLRDLDRATGNYDRTRRLRDVIGEHTPLYDWGHRLMALTGRDDGGNWGPPRVRDLYLRDEWVYPLRAGMTAAEAKPEGVHHLQITRDAMTAWDGVKRGETWRSFDSQDDGTTIRVGYLGDDGRLHDSGIDGRTELRRFRRWLLWDGWVVAEWLGLRRWAYYKGLSAAVDKRVPFTCQIVPPQGSGGYRHWHCTVRLTWREWLRRVAGRRPRHDGAHRFANYSWVDARERVEYDPLPSTGHVRADR